MTGRCLVCEAAVEHAKHTHLIATLASGRELRFVDPRRFGKLQVLEGSRFAAPGAEPIAAGRERFMELFKGRQTPIKSALLNQRLLSGIGNIYADESLFRAGVRPSPKGRFADPGGVHAALRCDSAGAGRGDQRGRIIDLRLCGCERRAADYSSYNTGFTSARASPAWFAARASNGWWSPGGAATIVQSANANG